MFEKKFRSIVVASMILTANIAFATTPAQIVKNDNGSTFNEIDDNYKDETGFAFYEDRNTTKINIRKKNTSCNCQEILKRLDGILEENKKQTKIQEKILKLLQDALDPQPEKIVVNGKECIANSSAECFKMPITPEAKRIPALKNWLENPSMENTVNYLQWQAKYFKEIFQRGDSFPLAISQFGTQAYPMPMQRVGYTDIYGFNPAKKAVSKILHNIGKKMKFLIFYGLNKDLDLVSILSLEKLAKKYPDFDFTIVFKDQKAKELFDSTTRILWRKSSKNKFKTFKQIISDSLIDKFDVFTTPSIVVVDGKKAQTITNGKIQVNYFEESFYNYLEYHKKIDHKQQADYNIWTEDTNYRERFYKNVYYFDINEALKNEDKK